MKNIMKYIMKHGVSRVKLIRSSAWRADQLGLLRDKWVEIPVGRSRKRSNELLELPDDELLREWVTAHKWYTTDEGFAIRGWYHLLYADAFKGKKVLDVGCGLAFDSISFAQRGAMVTFVDIVDTNVEIVRRLCSILGLSDVDFLYMQDFQSLSSLAFDYDVIMCMGSLMGVPFQIARLEGIELLKHLKIGGRWIELAYPKRRWLREGCLPFGLWGSRTDGISTPWMEWYDLPKLLRRLESARFDVILYHEFDNSQYNWFDLLRRE